MASLSMLSSLAWLMRTQSNPSLYIHFPWCVKKCPYCDFNSHTAINPDYQQYTQKLLADFDFLEHKFPFKKIKSIFFGGGTPSLCPPQLIGEILSTLASKGMISSETEITLESNPGTIDKEHIDGFLSAGVNRLSIGVQSFQDHLLNKIGRIHNGKMAYDMCQYALGRGFRSVNIDLMYGLITQTPNEALLDVKTALSIGAGHLSFYELTIEPNTYFYKYKPTLPEDKTLSEIESLCHNEIFHHMDQYEISAFCRDDAFCIHNLNYWNYGDYLGIGAGAHGKITTDDGIIRLNAEKNPKVFQLLKPEKTFKSHQINAKQEAFEFALNRWRLSAPIHQDQLNMLSTDAKKHFITHTHKAIKDELIINQNGTFHKTRLGKNYHNCLISYYL